MAEQTYLNNDKESFEVKEDKWYNLTTNRYLLKPSKRWYIENPMVVAGESPKEIEQFFINNNLPSQPILKKEPKVKVPKEAKAKPVKAAKSKIPKAVKTKVPKETKVKMPKAVKTKVPKETKVTAPKVTQPIPVGIKVPKPVKEPKPKVTNTTIPRPLNNHDSAEKEKPIRDTNKLFPEGSNACETWLNLSYRRTSLKHKEWYNLETSCRLKNLYGKTYLISPRVAGPAYLIAKFLDVNNIPLDKIKVPADSKIKQELEKYHKEAKPYTIVATSIDEVPETDLQQLGTFAFKGLTVKGRITYIVDGDTFDCAVIIPAQDMALPGAICVDRKMREGYNSMMVLNENPNQKKPTYPGILVKLRIRLYGVDAKEKDTEGGQVAKQLVTDWLLPDNNRVWLEMMGTDVKGRTLAKIYPRARGQEQPKGQSLTEMLINYKDTKHGQVAMAYYGDSNREQNWDEKEDGKNQKVDRWLDSN